MLTNTVSASEAAHILMLGLGPMRSWSDFLADNIRSRQLLCGLSLLPCCEQHDGRRNRPRYAVSDLRSFIQNVRLKIPEKYEIKAIPLEIDPAKAWFVRKLDKDGLPVSS